MIQKSHRKIRLREVTSVYFLFCFFSLFAQTNGTVYEKIKNVRIGIALGGGGARGLAHIGVLKALHERDIKPHIISGTSMGAIVGAVYAMGYTPEEMENIFTKINYEYLYSNVRHRLSYPLFFHNYEHRSILTLSFKGLQFQLPTSYARQLPSVQLYQRLLHSKGKYNSFSSLNKPFACVSTVVKPKQAWTHKSGNLIEALMASSAFPILFPPQRLDSIVHTDGGIVNNLPVEVLPSMGADVVIGVDVEDRSKEESNKRSRKKTKMDVASLAYSLILDETNATIDGKQRYMDLYIHPRIEGIGTFDFDDPASIIEIGYQSTIDLLDSLGVPALKNADLEHQFSPIIDEIESSKLNIKEISIAGRLKKYTPNYIRKIFAPSYPFTTTLSYLQQKMEELDALGSFSSVSYDILPTPNLNEDVLLLQLEEKKTDYDILLGATYSDHYYAEFMVGLRWNSFIFRNAYLMLQALFGSQVRYNANFHIDRGVIPGLGLSSSFYSYQFFNSIDPADLEGSRELLVQYNFRHRIYVQSHLKNFLALQVGAELNYASQTKDANFSLFSATNPLRNVRQFNLYAKVSVDNLDNVQFPMRGLKGSFLFRVSDLQDRTVLPLYTIHLNALVCKPLIPNKLSFLGKVAFGVNIQSGVDVSSVNAFKLGGAYDYNIYNAEQLYGYPTLALYTRNYHYLRAGVNWSPSSKLYVRADVNIANVFQSADEILSAFIYQAGDVHAGLGISVGYNSIIGPLILGLQYSDLHHFGILFRFGFVY